MVRVIKTETEYDAALARAYKLMDAEPGTPEAKELEDLVTLIEVYEEKNYPMPTSKG